MELEGSRLYMDGLACRVEGAGAYQLHMSRTFSTNLMPATVLAN